MSRKFFLMAGLAFILAACSQDPEPEQAAATFDNTLLGYVPADTPYYFVGGEDTPQEVMDKVAKMYDGIWGTMAEEAMADYEATLEELGSEGADEMEAMVIDVLERIEQDGLAAFGLDYRDDMVFYGQGILPVLRLDLSYPDKLRSLITMIEGHLGTALPVANHNGTEFWRFEDDGKVILFGIQDKMLAASMATLDGEAAMLDHLFGPPNTANSLTAAAVLEIANKYGFTSHAIGHLDIVDLARRAMAMDPSDPLYEVLSAEMDLDPACRDEILGFLSNAPSAVAGYKELSVERFSGSFILELEPTLANDLSGLAVALPGLGQPSDAPVSFGMAMDISGASRMARDWLKEAATRDFACEELANADYAGGAQQINPAALGMMGNPQGFFVRLDTRETDWMDDEDFSNASMSLSALFENPGTVMLMAQTFIPALQDMDIQPDGKVFNLDLEAMAAAMGEEMPPEMAGTVPEVWGVMSENLISVASGPGAEQRLQTLLNAPADQDPPILYYQIDMPWVMELSRAQMGKELQEMRELREIMVFDPEFYESLEQQQAEMDAEIAALEKSIEFTTAYGQVMGNTEFAIRFTSDGIRMDSTTLLP